MAVNLTSSQSDWISTFRSDCKLVLNALDALSGDRLKASVLGGISAFPPEAFAGSNQDVDGTGLTAALTNLTALRNLLYDPATGQPTAALIAIYAVAK